jgi:hypothetical protein
MFAYETGHPTVFKSYSMHSQAGATGKYYNAGFYFAPATEMSLANGSATQTLGAANVPYAAHAFFVAKDAGTASGGSTGTAKITVTGTSITDAGTRTGSDSEIIVADVTAMATDEYFETSKKWLGQITYTIAATGDHTTFTGLGNYGFCKYEDFGNRSFTITDFECVGFAGAADAGFDIELIHHKSTGWTYSAAAFNPGPAAVIKQTTIHSTESDVDANEPFAFKRSGLTTDVNGAGSEGIVVRTTTAQNNAVEYMDIHVGVTI